MSPVQSISRFFNHKVDVVNKFVDRVAKTPGLTKKVLQVTTKSFKTYDLYALKTSFPEFYADAKGAIAFIELYGLFSDAVYWMNPFTNKSIDQEKLSDSLDKFLKAHIPLEKKASPTISSLEKSKIKNLNNDDLIAYSKDLVRELHQDYELSSKAKGSIKKLLMGLSNKKDNQYSLEDVLKVLKFIRNTVLTSSSLKIKAKKNATEIVKEILEGKKEHYCELDVLISVKEQLLVNGYSFEEGEGLFEELKKELVIQKTSRPLIQRLYMVCFTLADLGTNLETLQKWQFINLANISAKIGSQSPVFAFVIKAGSDTVLGVIGSAGLVLVLGEAVWNSAKEGRKYFNEMDEEEKKKALKNFKKHLVEILVAGTDLVSTAAPIILVLTPQTVLILAIVAKGTAVVAVFVKEKL